ncbi:MAG: ATP-dependent dethiobiotin synthetase BioD [Methylocystaceae bacterium]|nr:ATP-dependent dethiobiotin synthetase BioD [Methylocystaceae bacterium]
MHVVIAGTSTNVGKTVFAAALVNAFKASYWKPVQSGLTEETDSQTVERLSGSLPQSILPEAYRLNRPISPHLAAKDDGVEIDPSRLVLPTGITRLVIEMAGGVMVPLSEELLSIDLMATWGLPVILVASTVLGTINHSLLSIEAMRRRGIVLHGIVFVGDEVDPVQKSISKFGEIKILGRMPWLDFLTRDRLAAAFNVNFRREDFIL